MKLMYIKPILYVIIGIVTTAVAQISLKRAGVTDQFKLSWFIFVFLSLFFYVASFISYYFALRNYDISTVQPIMMVSIVALITLYGFFAGESFTWSKSAGILIALLSIILISR
jgi:drug/metabolite transporter (DMT)-like permease